MNYTPEQLLAMPDAERDALAAEVCMGWELVKDDNPSPFGISDRPYWNGPAGETGCYADEWRPSQPTEKGKAQCWELAEKFDCFPTKAASGYWIFEFGFKEIARSKYPQKAVVTAAILAALAEQEK